MNQLTSTIVMVSPDQFGFNPETAKTNVFQNRPNDEKQTRDRALEEFKTMVKTLQANNIVVNVLNSRSDVITPDAVFPNNWFSSHEEGIVVLYPLLAKNRRLERQEDKLYTVLGLHGIAHPTVIDFTHKENEGLILEGTGSLVLDRVHRIAYAMGSPRTTKKLFNDWCNTMRYEGIFFHAYDINNLPIYHTNVVMSVGEEFAVLCAEAIRDKSECSRIQTRLEKSGKLIISLTPAQICAFCGNILQVKSTAGVKKIVMSKNAYEGFSKSQKKILSRFGELVVVDISTIEKVGGGSARCMMAELWVTR